MVEPGTKVSRGALAELERWHPQVLREKECSNHHGLHRTPAHRNPNAT